MLGRGFSDEQDTNVEINLSPMIDCIFILLIFFIVTTVFIEEVGFETHKPEAGSPPPPNEERQDVRVRIDAENNVYVNDRNVGVGGVASEVSRMLIRDDIPVIVQSSAKATQGTFTRVYGEVRKAGAKQITFNTKD